MMPMKMWGAKPGRKQSLMEQLVRREWETRLALSEGQASDFESMICSPYKSLEIDDFFRGERSKLLISKFDDLNLCWKVCRCSLEKAMTAAMTANEDRRREAAIPDWKKGDQLAENARKAMDALLSWMSEDPVGWRNNDREAAAIAIAGTVKSATFLKEMTVVERAEFSRSMAVQILEVRAFLARMPAEFEAHYRSLAAGNPGEVEKLAFVHTLAEGWVYLCGTVPAMGDSDFRLFVDAAWQDIGGKALDSNDGESFSHAIRLAVDSLKAAELPEGWLPNWLWSDCY